MSREGMETVSGDTAPFETRCSMNVAEAQKNFDKLVEKVYSEDVSIDVERGDKVIARLTPSEPQSPLNVGELNSFLRNLPTLGDDAEAFAKDIRAIRKSFPAETNP